MLQLVMIAMSLMCLPDVLIADEPTTALDVTIQAQILELLAEIQAEMGLAVILVTHNMGVVAEICDRVAVMYNGEIVEQADADSLFASPRHPYTEGLLRSRSEEHTSALQYLMRSSYAVICFKKNNITNNLDH